MRVNLHLLVCTQGKHDWFVLLKGNFDSELLIVVVRLYIIWAQGKSLAIGLQGISVALFSLIETCQSKQTLWPVRGQGNHLLEGLNSPIGAPVTGIELTQLHLHCGVVWMLFSALQVLDQSNTLGREMRQVRVETLGFLIGRNRVRKPLLSCIIHPKMDICRRLAWVECQHLLKTPNGLIVLLLVPGNVAKLTEAFEVAGMALQHRQGLLL